MNARHKLIPFLCGVLWLWSIINMTKDILGKEKFLAEIARTWSTSPWGVDLILAGMALVFYCSWWTKHE